MIFSTEPAYYNIVFDAFYKVKAEPYIFLGKPWLILLEAFLGSFGSMMYFNLNENHKWMSDYVDNFQSFYDFLVDEYGQEYKKSVWTAIFVGKSDEESYYILFEKIEKYVNKYSAELSNNKLYENYKKDADFYRTFRNMTLHQQVYFLLSGLRSNPSFFTNNKNPNAYTIKSYISGISMFCSMFDFDYNPFPGFNKFVVKKFDSSSRKCMYEIIFYEVPCKEQVKIFFELLSEYLVENNLIEYDDILHRRDYYYTLSARANFDSNEVIEVTTGNPFS